MKKYRVMCYHEEGGALVVVGKSSADAEEKVRAHLEENGFDGIETVGKYKTTHREYDVIEVEEL